MSCSNLSIAVCAGIACLLSACNKPEERSAQIEYLLPVLQENSVTKIQLNSFEGATDMELREGVWYVAGNVEYPAMAQSVESLLQTLTDAEVGKRINVAPADYGQLGLEEGGDGIQLLLGFESAPSLTLIMGGLDFPKDNSVGQVVGMGFTARRYIRVITSELDQTYLVPISLVDLTSAASFWTDASFCRVPSFKEIQFVHDGNVATRYYREHRFGPLLIENEDGSRRTVDPNRFYEFEVFLARGRCARLSDATTQLVQAPEAANGSVVLTDFMGMRYTFRFGQPIDPTETERQREALQAGFFSDGVAPTLVPFTVDADAENVDLNPFEQNVFERNQHLAKQIQGRVAYIGLEEVHCLFNDMKGFE